MNGFQQTRIGNDSDLLSFYASSGPAMEKALIECLKGADSESKLQVIKAGSALSEAGGEPFARAMLSLARDPQAEVREAVEYVYADSVRGALNIDRSAAKRKQTNSTTVREIVVALDSGSKEALAVTLPLLAELDPRSPYLREPAIEASLRKMLFAEPRPPMYEKGLLAVARFPKLLFDSDVQRRLLESIFDDSPAVKQAAVQAVLKYFSAAPAVGSAAEPYLNRMGPTEQRIFIAELGRRKNPLARRGKAAASVGQDAIVLYGTPQQVEGADPLRSPVFAAALVRSLNTEDDTVRAGALDIISRQKDLHARPDVRSALSKLRNDRSLRVRELASAVLDRREPKRVFTPTEVSQLLNYDFFVRRVQPILAKTGADGKACVVCHASHVVFRLEPPDHKGHFSDEASRSNYKYAVTVADPIEPEKSLILIKPTRPSDSAGDANDYASTHNGGQRWPANEQSSEYQVILQWIRGAGPEVAER